MSARASARNSKEVQGPAATRKSPQSKTPKKKIPSKKELPSIAEAAPAAVGPAAAPASTSVDPASSSGTEPSSSQSTKAIAAPATSAEEGDASAQFSQSEELRMLPEVSAASSGKAVPVSASPAAATSTVQHADLVVEELPGPTREPSKHHLQGGDGQAPSEQGTEAGDIEDALGGTASSTRARVEAAATSAGGRAEVVATSEQQEVVHAAGGTAGEGSAGAEDKTVGGAYDVRIQLQDTGYVAVVEVGRGAREEVLEERTEGDDDDVDDVELLPQPVAIDDGIDKERASRVEQEIHLPSEDGPSALSAEQQHSDAGAASGADVTDASAATVAASSSQEGPTADEESSATVDGEGSAARLIAGDGSSDFNHLEPISTSSAAFVAGASLPVSASTAAPPLAADLEREEPCIRAESARSAGSQASAISIKVGDA